jgi:Na+-transporting NADH:ubiquinone oxidoreductase subunit A
VKTIRIKKGISLSLAGEPRQVIASNVAASQVAWQVPTFSPVHATEVVNLEQYVKKGEALFKDTNEPKIAHTAPASGIVRKVIYSNEQLLQAIVIQCCDGSAVTFQLPKRPYSAEPIRSLLQLSGLWTQLRERPFDITPSADSEPHAIFVTAVDTLPYAADPALIIDERYEEFVLGLEALTQLTSGKVFVSQGSAEAFAVTHIKGVEQNVFTGRHPAGLVGTHIQYLHPRSHHSPVWHIGYQDVIAIGSLLSTGVLNSERVIALAGDPVQNPCLVRTQVGASIEDLLTLNLKGSINDTESICGSIFAGRRSNYLGRFDLQVSIFYALESSRNLPDSRYGDGRHVSREEQLLSMNAFVAEPRFDSVSPLNILATPLLRALISGDVENATALGCLDLTDEDLETFSYVCPASNDYPGALRLCHQKIRSNYP